MRMFKWFKGWQDNMIRIDSIKGLNLDKCKHIYYIEYKDKSEFILLFNREYLECDSLVKVYDYIYDNCCSQSLIYMNNEAVKLLEYQPWHLKEVSSN